MHARAGHIGNNARLFPEIPFMSMRFAVRGEYIALDQLLKVTGLVGSGGEAHRLIEAGEVRVDGRPETRKTAKIRAGQQVTCRGVTLRVTG